MIEMIFLLYSLFERNSRNTKNNAIILLQKLSTLSEKRKKIYDTLLIPSTIKWND